MTYCFVKHIEYPGWSKIAIAYHSIHCPSFLRIFSQFCLFAFILWSSNTCCPVIPNDLRRGRVHCNSKKYYGILFVLNAEIQFAFCYVKIVYCLVKYCVVCVFAFNLIIIIQLDGNKKTMHFSGFQKISFRHVAVTDVGF